MASKTGSVIASMMGPRVEANPPLFSVERAPEKTKSPSSQFTELLDTPPMTVSFCTYQPSTDPCESKSNKSPSTLVAETEVDVTTVDVSDIAISVVDVSAVDGASSEFDDDKSSESAQAPKNHATPTTMAARKRMSFRIIVRSGDSTPTDTRLAHPPHRRGRGRRVRSTNERNDMKNSTTARLGVAVVAIAIMGAACGGGDSGSSGADNAEKTAYSEALAVALGSDVNFPFDEKETLCIAQGVVDVMGLQMFLDAGVSAEDITADAEFDFPDLTDEQNTDLVNVFLDGECVDMGQLMADAMMEQSAGALTEEQASCIGDGIASSEGFGQVLTAEITGADSTEAEAAMEDEFLGLIMECDIPLDSLG